MHSVNMIYFYKVSYFLNILKSNFISFACRILDNFKFIIYNMVYVKAVFINITFNYFIAFTYTIFYNFYKL